MRWVAHFFPKNLKKISVIMTILQLYCVMFLLKTYVLYKLITGRNFSGRLILLYVTSPPTTPYPLPNRSLRTTSLARVFAWRLSSFRSEFCAAWRWSNDAVPIVEPPLANLVLNGRIYPDCTLQLSWRTCFCLEVRKKGLHVGFCMMHDAFLSCWESL